MDFRIGTISVTLRSGESSLGLRGLFSRDLDEYIE